MPKVPHTERGRQALAAAFASHHAARRALRLAIQEAGRDPERNFDAEWTLERMADRLCAILADDA